MSERKIPDRKPRADAQRNRERLIDAAKAAFTEAGPEVSLEEIARRAGVGIGTLYRHFPTRDAIVEAVYRRELTQITEAAERLLAEESSPLEALRAWLRLSVDYLATKKVIAPAMNAIPGGTAQYQSGPLLQLAVERLVEAALAEGEVRGDLEPGDILQAMAGLSYGAGQPGWQASALRLIDVLVEGLRASGAAARG